MATGQRFTEPDERKAVEKFRDLTYQPNSQQVHVAEIMGTHESAETEPQWDYDVMGRAISEQQVTGVRFDWGADGKKLLAGIYVPEQLLYRLDCRTDTE